MFGLLGGTLPFFLMASLKVLGGTHLDETNYCLHLGLMTSAFTGSVTDSDSTIDNFDHKHIGVDIAIWFIASQKLRHIWG